MGDCQQPAARVEKPHLGADGERRALGPQVVALLHPQGDDVGPLPDLVVEVVKAVAQPGRLLGPRNGRRGAQRQRAPCQGRGQVKIPPEEHHRR